jgi:hypothetical protein
MKMTTKVRHDILLAVVHALENALLSAQGSFPGKLLDHVPPNELTKRECIEALSPDFFPPTNLFHNFVCMKSRGGPC